jgi:hypothetical protein
VEGFGIDIFQSLANASAVGYPTLIDFGGEFKTGVHVDASSFHKIEKYLYGFSCSVGGTFC